MVMEITSSFVYKVVISTVGAKMTIALKVPNRGVLMDSMIGKKRIRDVNFEFSRDVHGQLPQIPEVILLDLRQ